MILVCVLCMSVCLSVCQAITKMSEKGPKNRLQGTEKEWKFKERERNLKTCKKSHRNDNIMCPHLTRIHEITFLVLISLLVNSIITK